MHWDGSHGTEWHVLWCRVPWSRVSAMQQGNAMGSSEGPLRVCCLTQCSPSQEPLAHSPALCTWPHPAPTGLAGCLSSLHTREALGTQKWGPLDSRFPSHLILCLWADDVPPPPAPFPHRTVTLRSASVSSQFSLNSKDILGG